MANEEPHTHEYRATITWTGSTGDGYDRYLRDHRGSAPPSTTDVSLSSDPAFHGDGRHLNPEQLVVLAAASCQLLSFLAVAARARVDVCTYDDAAHAVMPEDDPPIRLTRIDLSPHIGVIHDGSSSLLRRVERLVELAHRECYIANSLRTEIVVTPVITLVAPT